MSWQCRGQMEPRFWDPAGTSGFVSAAHSYNAAKRFTSHIAKRTSDRFIHKVRGGPAPLLRSNRRPTPSPA